MSKYIIEQPPKRTGVTATDLVNVYSYLYRMNDNLQIALANLGAENFTPEGLKSVQKADKEQAEKQEQEYLTLRSLIIKTADTIQQEMDEIVQTLEGEYLAISDFGTYRESVTAEIVATANEIVQSYGYDAQLQALSDANASFGDYRTTTEQYIKTGLLYFDGAIPRYGVAVGEKLTTVVVDGQTVLSRQDLCATFTSNRLSFWQGGVELAYVSNSQLHIAAADVDRMDMGSWRISHTYGFTIEWIGG